MTILHHAALKNSLSKAQIIVKHLELQVPINERNAWVNFKTEGDQFTAVHFASYKGNTNLIKFLVSKGAKLSEENKFGLNGMHVSAQGDQAGSLVSLHFNFVSISSKSKASISTSRTGEAVHLCTGLVSRRQKLRWLTFLLGTPISTFKTKTDTLHCTWLSKLPNNQEVLGQSGSWCWKERGQISKTRRGISLLT